MYYLILLLLLPTLVFGGEKLALVSMAPYVEIVEELTSGQVQVDLLVPAGFSSHTYEPTPKQILNATKASIWFQLGELFEERVQKALQAENPKLVLVDLRQGLSLLGDCCHDHDHNHHHAADTHIWMSPKMMQKQIETIAQGLVQVFPDLKETVEKNKGPLLTKLSTLDKEIQGILQSHKGEIVFVSHPAYGYFCRDYGLVQESIEFEGKDPTPKTLYLLIEQAKKDQVHTIFIQKQYSTKAATLVAREIDAKLVELDPYSPHYFSSMLHIAKSFAESR
jgi:zinc transport system substrate-binding protein